MYLGFPERSCRFADSTSKAFQPVRRSKFRIFKHHLYYRTPAKVISLNALVNSMINDAECLEQTVLSPSKDAKPALSQLEKFTALVCILQYEQNFDDIRRRYTEWRADKLGTKSKNIFSAVQKEIVDMLAWLYKRNCISEDAQISPGGGPLRNEIYYNLRIPLEILKNNLAKTFSK